MKCVLLVGGQGTRLRPLTYSLPKQMLPVVDVPMIERVIGHLAQYGVDEVVLSLGYKPDAFIEAFPAGMIDGVKLEYAIEPEPLDTAGAIKFAATYAEIDSTFLVVNGDILTDLKVDELVKFHENAGAMATITLVEVQDPSAFGVVVRDENGKVGDFIEKPPKESAPANTINAGTYVVDPDVLSLIDTSRKVSIEREIFPALASKESLYSMVSTDYWIDTGTCEKYLAAHWDLLLGTRDEPPNPRADRVADNLWCHGECELDGRVGEISYFGQLSRCLDGSFVSRSVVGPGCVIGRGAKVVNSVLLGGVTVSDGAVVESSVIGAGATIGDKAQITDFSVVGFHEVISPSCVIENTRVPL